MKDKKSLTEDILNNIGKNKKLTNTKELNIDCNIKNNFSKVNQTPKENNSVKLDLDSFIMVPINHPNINEIINLLNNFDNNTENRNKQEEKKEEPRNIITLNDISNSNQKDLIIPNNSIITPMALDYIKLKNIKIRYTK